MLCFLLILLSPLENFMILQTKCCSQVATCIHPAYMWKLFLPWDYEHFLLPFCCSVLSGSPCSVKILFIHVGKLCWCFVPFPYFFVSFSFFVSDSIIHATMKIHHPELFLWLSETKRSAPIHDGSFFVLVQPSHNVRRVFLCVSQIFISFVFRASFVCDVWRAGEIPGKMSQPFTRKLI